MSFARWQPYYTDRELELDRRIHAFGLLLALIATPLLLGLAAESRRPGLVLPCAIYLLSLLGMLGSSTLFRHTPLRWSKYRWFLRRLDHAAIFLFIAGKPSDEIARTTVGEEYAIERTIRLHQDLFARLFKLPHKLLEIGGWAGEKSRLRGQFDSALMRSNASYPDRSPSDWLSSRLCAQAGRRNLCPALRDELVSFIDRGVRQ